MSTTRTTKRATVADVVGGALSRSVSRLEAHGVTARDGDDPEELHQCRVATRRLRSDLRTFRSLLDQRWVTELRDELAWLADAMGAVRDLDVLREMVLRRAADLPDLDRESARRLVTLLDADREAARAAMVAALDSNRYGALVDALRIAADTPKFERDPLQRAKPTVATLVQRTWARLERAVADLNEPMNDTALHDVRIKAKRVRYACDAAAPVWGDKASRLATAAAKVQDVLGRINDAAVAETWLREAAVREPSLAVVAGEFIADCRSAAAASRGAFPSVWRRAAEPSRRKWLR